MTWSKVKPCCRRLAREHGEEEWEGGSEGRRKKSVDQPCEVPGSVEGK